MKGVLKKVTPLDDFILEAEFTSGVVKRYDLKPLMDEIEYFVEMKENPEIFKDAIVEIGGYGISWNDVLDVAAEEVWEKGITVN